MKANEMKGARAEETLRNYFLSMGYFVVRGCKFRYRGFDVTDVDLWLYGRSSALLRERINVDIKNKKTPQALERIFWAKGLQSVLGLDACVVATASNTAPLEPSPKRRWTVSVISASRFARAPPRPSERLDSAR
jgi:hypothetical protein